MKANRERKHKLTLYLSDDEYYVLKCKTKAANMRSMSSVLRHLIIYGFIYDVDYRYILNYNCELGRIGRNLNQIARHTNETGTITAEEFQDVKNIMDQIWKLQLNFLKKVPLAPEHNIGEFNKKYHTATQAKNETS